MGKRLIRLAIFDFDSTLMDGETIDFLAKPLGLDKEVSFITTQAMEGKIDFFESLSRRVALLKGLGYAKAQQICENLPFIKGASECISELKKQDIKVLVFSGGFSLATRYAKDTLGFDADFSNILHHKGGKLTGLVGGEMMFSNSKGLMLERMQDVLGISKEQTLCVGDGANDLSMFAHANKKVAFCAKPALKKEANIIIDTKDLTQILEHI